MYKFTTDSRYSKVDFGHVDSDKDRWFIVCRTVSKVTPDQRRVGLYKPFATKPTAKQVRAAKKDFRNTLRGMYANSN